MGSQKNPPKKILATLFPYIFHIKTKWNIVYKYLKTEIFSRDTNILPQMHGISKYLWTLSYCHWGFWVSLSYPILNLKKTVCPKDVWMQHCTKTQKDLKLSEATYSKEETNWNNLQGPETTYIKQETTWSNLYQARNDLKQSTTSKKQPTMSWTYQQRAKQDAKQPTTSRFWDYFTIWGNWFSSLTRFPSNIWLQSFKHCFMENNGENRAPNICILPCIFIVRCKICRIHCKPLWHL